MKLEEAFAILFAEINQKSSGSHKHKCQHCRHVWGHPDYMAGDVEAHTCPACGTVLASPWVHYREKVPYYVEF